MKHAVWVGAWTVLFTAPAMAQAPTLQAAERAYQSVDFPATHAMAERALAAGGATHEQTLRLYVLLGISAAALGDREEATRDFVIALAVDPTLKLDRELSPKMREPYLEAQGYWAAAPKRLTLGAKPSRDSKQLDVTLVDPKSLVAAVEVSVSGIGVLPRSKFVLENKPLNRLTLPPALERRAFEFTVRAVDRFGNVLAERGTDNEPELALPPPTRNATGSAGVTAQESKSYLWPVLFGVGALGAAGAGAVFHLQREAAAHDWNGPACENRGQTRLDQCRGVDARRERNERWAIGLYATSGVLLTGGLITLLSGKSKDTSAVDVGVLGCTLFERGVRCDGRF